MDCPKCSEAGNKHGKTRDGQQRFRCKSCGKTFSEPKPLPGLSTDLKTAAMALKMLLEGMSIRATSRLTGLNKDTVQRLVERAGEQCDQFMADTMQELHITDIQVDEVWSFVAGGPDSSAIGAAPAARSCLGWRTDA